VGVTGPVASLVSVGDELLVGRTIDTNAAWLSERLTSIGLPVAGRWTTGDTEEGIGNVLADALDLSQVVIFTGGLGPTRDDLTSSAVLSALGVDSTSGKLLNNSLGTAPGFVLEPAGKLVILLPGVPRELRAIFDQEVRPLLEARFGSALQPYFERRIHTTGIRESVLAERIEAALMGDTAGADLAFYPDLRGVDLVFRLSGRTPEFARSTFDMLEARVSTVVAPYRFASERGDVVEAIAGMLVARGHTLAVAESCTGGLIAKRLTDQAGASRYFLGGVIAYDNRVKQEVLGVSASSLAEDGAVSKGVAEQMARGVAERLGTDAGIGLTGVAGPGGGTAGKPVGTVWYAVHLQDHLCCELQTFAGDREAIRERAAQAALALLYHMIHD